MACLLKAPEGPAKGCIVFTTQERDHVILRDAAVQAQVEALKQRYVIGLHHNWHDHHFRYNPLFDFSMAGDGDLIEAEGRDFARIPLDACNFAPPCYSAPRGEAFWDILYVARAVNFKGIPELFATIRKVYDSGRSPRVLFLCPVPEQVELPGIADLRLHFESLFNLEERKRFTLLTLDWDYPFPLDAETLAHFYRHSRIFFHPAPQERRCRTAAYAWAGRMPVVSNDSVASILPQAYHQRPFLYRTDGETGMVETLTQALDQPPSDSAQWQNVSDEFSASACVDRLAQDLDRLAAAFGWGALATTPINPSKLDYRLGRHHGLSLGDNRVDLSVGELCQALETINDEEIAASLMAPDPEDALRQVYRQRYPATAPAKPQRRSLLEKLGLIR